MYLDKHSWNINVQCNSSSFLIFYFTFYCNFQILESLDDHYAEESVLFMGVLNELSKAVVRWFPVDEGSQTCKCGNQPHCQCHNQLKCKNEKTNASGASVEQQSIKNIGTEEKLHTCNSESGAKSDSSQNVTDSSGNLTSKCSCSRQFTNTGNAKNCCTHQSHVNVSGCSPCAGGIVSPANQNTSDTVGRNTEELKNYFSNLLKLESEARGEFSEEELESRYILLA